MKRREILRYTAYVTGAVISAPLLTTFLSGCQTEPIKGTAEGLSFFTNDEFSLLKEVIDTILPKTDSPSATDVGVHNIIDNMIGLCYSETDQGDFRDGFTALGAYLKLSSEHLSSLKNLEEGGAQEEVRKAYLDLKQQTVAYYLSTEEVATNYLNYLPVPGEYQPCITMEEVDGKAWAL